MRERIPYTQTWEDVDLLRRALQIDTHAHVLTITSGGGAPVSVLADHPASLITVDANPSQTLLFHLIAAAAEALPYEEFVQFLGVRQGYDRVAVFQSTVATRLDQIASTFWHARLSDIAAGVIHTGKLERFFRFFAHHVVSHLVSRSAQDKLLSAQTLDEQAMIFHQEWDTWRLRFGLRVFFSRAVMRRFARDRAYFVHANLDPGREYVQRTLRGLTHIPARTNWMLEYMLRGEYQQTIPPMYNEQAWLQWRRIRDTAYVVTGDIHDVIHSAAEPFSHVHLSDIFEGFTTAHFHEFFASLAQKMIPGGRVFFWRNLATPSIDTIKQLGFRSLDETSTSLWTADRGFFYKDCILLERTT